MKPAPPCPAPTRCWQIHSVWATSPLSVAVRYIFCSFSPPSYVALRGSKAPHRHACERVFCCVETSSPSQLLPWDRSASLNLLFLFLSFIFFSTSFQRDWAVFLGAWCPPSAFRSCFVEVAQHSNDLLMNLWGRKLSSCPTFLPSWDCRHNLSTLV